MTVGRIVLDCVTSHGYNSSIATHIGAVMKQYTLAIEPTSFEIYVVADSEKEARQILWAAMPDSVKNCAECMELIEVESAYAEQSKGVQGNPFSHIYA